jgi:phage terminase large subunit-like protein
LIGRRGGKSRIAAALAVYFACFVPNRLARGEHGMVLVLAASQEQAKVVFNYAKAFLTESLVLRQEIAAITRHEIRLKNGITIAVHANSFRSVSPKGDFIEDTGTKSAAAHDSIGTCCSYQPGHRRQ